MLRLQDVYHLDVRDLSRGEVGGAVTKAKLSAQDCLYLGKHTFNSGALSRSLEWFEEAWYLAGQGANKTGLSQAQAQQFLDQAAKVVCLMGNMQNVVNGQALTANTTAEAQPILPISKDRKRRSANLRIWQSFGSCKNQEESLN